MAHTQDRADSGGEALSEKRIYRLVHDEARRRASQDCLHAEHGWVVTVSEPSRSLEMNAKLHAMLTDISRQAMYMGKARTVDFWKGLFVSGWQIATDQHPEIVPGLEGEFINIRESTATMSGRKLSGVIEYIQAWAVMNGIQFFEHGA